jgi:TIR domain
VGGEIFVNYRRDDDAGHTGRLYDLLKGPFKRDRIFMDVDGIEPSLDFRKKMVEQVEKCRVFLVVIGSRWLDIQDATGARRLDSQDDFVRLEIELALKRKKFVIPILVGGAIMPLGADLPESIRALSELQAIHLTHDRFESDAERLIKTIKKVLRPSLSRMPIIGFLGLLMASLLIGVGLLLFRSSNFNYVFDGPDLAYYYFAIDIDDSADLQKSYQLRVVNKSSVPFYKAVSWFSPAAAKGNPNAPDRLYYSLGLQYFSDILYEGSYIIGGTLPLGSFIVQSQGTYNGSSPDISP